MTTYARIVNEVAVDVSTSPTTQFAPAVAAQFVVVPDGVGPQWVRLAEIIAEADILVPCWGDRNKVPPHLRHHFDALKRLIFASGKPVKIFGLTAGGDPKHPLMLGYDTQLVDWAA